MNQMESGEEMLIFKKVECLQEHYRGMILGALLLLWPYGNEQKSLMQKLKVCFCHLVTRHFRGCECFFHH